MEKIKNLVKKYKFGLITTLVILLAIFLDQLSKILTDGKDINIIENFFWFSSTHNQGAAYGIFSGHTTLLIVVSVIMLVLIFVYNLFHKKKTFFYSISLGLIVGGAIGNLIDRVFFGYVRDFIKFSFFSFNCNIADICLTFGVILFAIYLIFFDNFKQKRKSELWVK